MVVVVEGAGRGGEGDGLAMGFGGPRLNDLASVHSISAPCNRRQHRTTASLTLPVITGLELPARARDHALRREQQITGFRQRRGGCAKEREKERRGKKT